MLLLQAGFFIGMVLLAIAIAGWLHIGCFQCRQKV